MIILGQLRMHTIAAWPGLWAGPGPVPAAPGAVIPGFRCLTGRYRREYTFWHHMSPPGARLRLRSVLACRRLPTEVGSVTTGRAADHPAGGRILVVDDEPDMGGLIERVLTADG